MQQLNVRAGVLACCCRRHAQHTTSCPLVKSHDAVLHSSSCSCSSLGPLAPTHAHGWHERCLDEGRHRSHVDAQAIRQEPGQRTRLDGFEEWKCLQHQKQQAWQLAAQESVVANPACFSCCTTAVTSSWCECCTEAVSHLVHAVGGAHVHRALIYSCCCRHQGQKAQQERCDRPASTNGAEPASAAAHVASCGRLLRSWCCLVVRSDSLGCLGVRRVDMGPPVGRVKIRLCCVDCCEQRKLWESENCSVIS